MIADALGPGRSEKKQVRVAKREQQPSEERVRHHTPGSERQEQFHIFNHDHEQSRGRTGPPAFRDNFHWAGQLFQTVERESPEIHGVRVKGMAKGRYQVSVTAGLQDSQDLTHHLLRVPDVFEDCVALHARKQIIGERQLLCIRDGVDSGDAYQVYIDVAGNDAARTSQVKIPAAEGEVGGLGGIHDEGSGRLQNPKQAIEPMAGSSGAILCLERTFRSGLGHGARRSLVQNNYNCTPGPRQVVGCFHLGVGGSSGTTVSVLFPAYVKGGGRPLVIGLHA